ncbi:MAG TPA: metal ABC transporter ATP-binding protein [Solirubrobacteraceae bacterium]|jgi:manganese/iron transport system ATP-binding protein/manganese/zinc/iron transport system ATP- binding protein|nr:metal ABC transporter ATP-binding protein [Solirubrobacteraceae bacterium]
MTTAAPALQVTDLAAAYAEGPPALRGVTFSAEPGQAVAVLGPNGGGKTTLFRALLGELPAVAGSVRFDGAPAYVPQTERSRLDFPVSALDVALMGAYARTPWYRRIAAADRERARAALARVGLGDRAAARFGTLSGGQRQRVLVARALVQDARLLLLDEPFAGVDRTSEEAIMGILDELRAEGRVLLIATHDIEQARRWDRVLCLHGEQIAYGPPASTLTTDVLEGTYGAEIVLLEGGERCVAVQHHHH